MAVIPPALEPSILAKAGEGRTLREIAAWLKSDHGVECSHVSVQRIVKRAKIERAEVTRAVLQEKLGKSVTTDVDRLEKHARQLDKMADDIYAKVAADATFLKGPERDEPTWVDGRETYAKLAEQLRKITETKLKYSGAEEAVGDGRCRGPIIFVPPESDD